MILCTVFAGFSKNRDYLKLHPFSKILREFMGQVYCGYKVKLSLTNCLSPLKIIGMLVTEVPTILPGGRHSWLIRAYHYE